MGSVTFYRYYCHCVNHHSLHHSTPGHRELWRLFSREYFACSSLYVVASVGTCDDPGTWLRTDTGSAPAPGLVTASHDGPGTRPGLTQRTEAGLCPGLYLYSYERREKTWTFWHFPTLNRECISGVRTQRARQRSRLPWACYFTF